MEKQRKIPPIGLINKSTQGCYVNSVIQALYSLPIFVNDLLLKTNYMTLSTYNSVDTFYFLENYSPDSGDPNEFLLEVMSGLSDTLFTMKYSTTFQCVCGKQTKYSEEKQMLCIRNGNEKSIEAILKDSPLNSNTCSCGNEIIGSVDFQLKPTILCICIQNVEQCGSELRKICTSVSQHHTITFYDQQYELNALVTHVGNDLMGHCKAYVNTKCGWYGLDDANVYKWNGLLDTSSSEVVVGMFYQLPQDLNESVIIDEAIINKYHDFLDNKSNYF
ncbi:USP domain-containing protein [Entamoeba marina]